jgi:hypothetical protein
VLEAQGARAGVRRQVEAPGRGPPREILPIGNISPAVMVRVTSAHAFASSASGKSDYQTSIRGGTFALLLVKSSDHAHGAPLLVGERRPAADVGADRIDHDTPGRTT